MCCECECECRPLGFLLGLPFALLCLLISIVGVAVWIVGYCPSLSLPWRKGVGNWCRLLLSCICPCCLCVTVLVEVALELIKAPIHVMEWFTSKIPC
ncbi:hypothetical protein EJ110_NYTH20874 [Nymphaea thermarum]|nr:hypothetical protein EJ110_NYTH20874 [Nymphaea thermarum]